ncbi:hypothetical protein J6590_011044 [Homalodisca vitripennis]|nr:hypothetical protein J6590_011044 [Homalodisca vitripennis]
MSLARDYLVKSQNIIHLRFVYVIGGVGALQHRDVTLGRGRVGGPLTLPNNVATSRHSLVWSTLYSALSRQQWHVGRYWSVIACTHSYSTLDVS